MRFCGTSSQWCGYYLGSESSDQPSLFGVKFLNGDDKESNMTSGLERRMEIVAVSGDILSLDLAVYIDESIIMDC